ncbi:MAG TPA: Maf family protein [Syntrophomonadaceae bacterium]|nr:Maf family protein [Syntrophomonadaceae bacterium]
MKPIILASQSPRRKELLARLGLVFTTIPANIDEEMTSSQYPQTAVQEIAFQKAKYVSELVNDGLIISADTVVVWKDNVLGKPADQKNAFEMLKMLSGQEHQVITGLCLWDVASGRYELESEMTVVHFRRLTDKEIKNYVSTGEPMDKAGAYGIQGLGSMLVDRIEGCYYNVVGLPLTRLYLMMEHYGINLLGG